MNGGLSTPAAERAHRHPLGRGPRIPPPVLHLTRGEDAHHLQAALADLCAIADPEPRLHERRAAVPARPRRTAPARTRSRAAGSTAGCSGATSAPACRPTFGPRPRSPPECRDSPGRTRVCCRRRRDRSRRTCWTRSASTTGCEQPHWPLRWRNVQWRRRPPAPPGRRKLTNSKLRLNVVWLMAGCAPTSASPAWMDVAEAAQLLPGRLVELVVVLAVVVPLSDDELEVPVAGAVAGLDQAAGMGTPPRPADRRSYPSSRTSRTCCRSRTGCRRCGRSPARHRPAPTSSSRSSSSARRRSRRSGPRGCRGRHRSRGCRHRRCPCQKKASKSSNRSNAATSGPTFSSHCF